MLCFNIILGLFPLSIFLSPPPFIYCVLLYIVFIWNHLLSLIITFNPSVHFIKYRKCWPLLEQNTIMFSKSWVSNALLLMTCSCQVIPWSQLAPFFIYFDRNITRKDTPSPDHWTIWSIPTTKEPSPWASLWKHNIRYQYSISYHESRSICLYFTGRYFRLR
jgi:hypothetical protein